MSEISAKIEYDTECYVLPLTWPHDGYWVWRNTSLAQVVKNAQADILNRDDEYPIEDRLRAILAMQAAYDAWQSEHPEPVVPDEVERLLIEAEELNTIGDAPSANRRIVAALRELYRQFKEVSK